MRKLLISLAAAGAALAVASPASAQYYGGQPYGGQGYNGNAQGYGYGYGRGNFGEVRALQARIDSIEYQIRMLDRRDVIRDGRADRLREEAQRLESRLHRAARSGLNPYEANDIRARIAQLEQRVQFAMANRDGRYGRGHYGHDRDDDRDRY